MNNSTFETVHSILSPVNASELSGRYETTAVDKDGNPVQVLRSIRHAPKELVLRGTITPKKRAAVPSFDAVDDLCDLFQAKATITPIKNRSSWSSAEARSAPGAPFGNARGTADEVDSVKENLGEALGMAKATRFSDDTKPAAVTPVRRSRRRRS